MRVAIGLRLEANEDWEQAATYVTEAERLGVDFVWSHESWGLDAVTPLAFMAARTSRIRLGSGIMQAGTRTPALVAMTALSLASMSSGRFVLGMGVSGPQVIEGWHGLRFDRPVTRMREIVEIVRRAARGERVAFKGQVYELPLPGGEGKALRSSAQPRPDIPVYLATLSPRSLELTGEIADGWLGTSFMPDHARIFFDHLEVGARRAGRTLGDLDLQAGGAVAFGDDVERLIAARKPGLAFTLGAMGSRQHNFYNDAFKRAGYVDAATEVQRLWLDGKRDEAAARVPDEMALKANLLGTEAMVRDRLRVYRASGLTTLRVDPAGATLDARLATLGQLMELVKTSRGGERVMAGEPEILRERSRSLEDEFFRREDARLKENLRHAAQRESAREVLTRASGIKNPKVVDRLIDLDIHPETVTALSLVPLVEVAWADGSLDAKERSAILERVDETEFAPGSPARALLEGWLTRKPEPKLMNAWTHLVEGLAEQMTREEVAALKKGLLERARAVAGASGGFLGVGAKISTAEANVISRLESAFPAGK
jgi:F420-dependent oxidoreductase-like protein